MLDFCIETAEAVQKDGLNMLDYKEHARVKSYAEAKKEAENAFIEVLEAVAVRIVKHKGGKRKEVYRLVI